MTILDFVGTSPVVRPGIAMIQLHDELWRVTRTSGEVLGYVESRANGADRSYFAKRLLAGQQRSLPLGEFWNIDDAIDCFRFS